jgi:hypothetical protein
MSWIDDVLGKFGQPEQTDLADRLDHTRDFVFYVLDEVYKQVEDPELAFAYGLDTLLLTYGKYYENTYTHFALEWLDDKLPDDEEMEEV